MPSVKCPMVKDWNTGRVIADWISINHCLPCPYAQGIKIDFKSESGKVYCGA